MLTSQDGFFKLPVKSPYINVKVLVLHFLKFHQFLYVGHNPKGKIIEESQT